MFNQFRLFGVALLTLGVFALSACDSSSASGSGTGTISIAVTDAPVDSATAVVVEFTGITLQPQDGEAIEFDFDEPRHIDLLSLQGDASELLLEDETVAAGQYVWMRLKVNALNGELDSYIELDDGSQHGLFIPGGAQSGLKLVSGFSVPEGGAAAFTIDFDLRKSVVKPAAVVRDYQLKPVLRLVENEQAGGITGTVDASWVSEADCSAAVYAYLGVDVTLGSEGSDNPPLSSALVALNPDTGDYDYQLGFLPAGEYTLAFTCQADLDQPDELNEIEFLASEKVEVSGGASTTLNFVAPF